MRARTTVKTTIAFLLAALVATLVPSVAYGAAHTADLAARLWATRPTPTAALTATSWHQGAPRFTRIEVSSLGELRETISSLGSRTTLGWDLPTNPLAAAQSVPNDRHWRRLWGVRAVNAPKVWDRTKGSGVVVAVLDTGVNDVPDLAGQILPGATFQQGVLTPGAIDGHGHGTHVAGTVAALLENRVGVAGVAPEAKILPVKVLGDTGIGAVHDVVAGVVWAVENGAHVINLSLSTTSQTSAFDAALTYAESMGVLVVAAAGNSAGEGSPVSYPAALPGVVAVGALNQNLTPAPFSTRGEYVDLAAPGVAIRSTSNAGGYSTDSGTSMAAPHVAGVAALLRAAHPGSTAAQIRAALESSLTDVYTPGFDTATGNGLVNAEEALRSLDLLAATDAPVASASSATPRWRVLQSDILITAPSTHAAPTYEFLRDGALLHTAQVPWFRDKDIAKRRGAHLYEIRAIGADGGVIETWTTSVGIKPPRTPRILKARAGEETENGRMVTLELSRVKKGTTVLVYRNKKFLGAFPARKKIQLEVPSGRSRFVVHAVSDSGHSAPSNNARVTR